MLDKSVFLLYNINRKVTKLNKTILKTNSVERGKESGKNEKNDKQQSSEEAGAKPPALPCETSAQGL